MVFRFTLPADDDEPPDGGRVYIRISDVTGRKVACFDAGIRRAVEQSAGFDAGRLPNGIYLATLAVSCDGSGVHSVPVLRIVVVR